MSTAVALRRAGWRHPEASAATVAALAWLLLLVPTVGIAGPGDLHADAHQSAPLVAGAVGWMLMAVAMMVPAALPVARTHALRAMWARRQRTVGIFCASYVGVWAVFGAVAYAATAVVEVGDAELVAAALLAGAAWELAPAKWRAVRSCHLIPALPPRGTKADLECVRAGATYGRRCVTACWPAMLAMAIAGHASLGLMVLLTAVITAEKVLVRSARLAGPIAASLAAAALVTLVA